MALSAELKDRLQHLVDENKVILFMKGTRQAPQCGFSAQVVQILDEYLPEYATVNVLADAEVRQGIKEFSDWPTLPQLFVDGELVGGCDIVRDMHGSGELSNVLGAKPADIAPPRVVVTDSARRAFEEARADAEYPHLRFEIGPGFAYALSFGPELPGDVVVDGGGIELRLDRGSARKAEGTTIDFLQGPGGAGFKITNPNEPKRVGAMSAAELHHRLHGGEALHLFDVRTEGERRMGAIGASVMFDQAAEQRIAALPKDALLVFICASGARSGRAAQRYLEQGYTNVHNVIGGMQAWEHEARGHHH